MDLTPDELDELIGLWALAARDDDSLGRALDDSLDEALDAMIGELADPVAAVPPAEVFEQVMHVARRTTRPEQTVSTPLALLEHQIGALDALVDTLAGDDWAAVVAPYDWTVQQLLTHLAIVDRYTGRQMGLTSDGPDPERTAHLRLGADRIAAALDDDPASTIGTWRRNAAALLDGLRSGAAPDLDAETELHGWPFRVRGAIVARAFETWTHADDIRRALGRPVEAPSADDLRAMSRFSVSTLPLLYPIVASGETFTDGARVVLTGEGGGTYDLGDGERSTLLVLDVVAYCRMAARRAAVGELDLTIEGDVETAHRLLGAAQVFAV